MVPGVTGAAGVSAGLAAAGCGGGKKQGAPGGTAGGGDDPSPSARATPNPGQRGGTLQYTGYVKSDGKFDPHKTQAGPFYGQQASYTAAC